jgi:hypothetical protein
MKLRRMTATAAVLLAVTAAVATAFVGAPSRAVAPNALVAAPVHPHHHQAAHPHRHRGTLPAGALRGPAHELPQYPTVALATPTQRAAAIRLLAESRRSVSRWPTPAAAAAAGFDTRPARRARPERVGYLHAEHRRFSDDRHYLDPRRPEALIYANVRGRSLVLVGMMFSMPRGVRGPTPGGPITRWHTHRVCARGDERGLAPRPDGSCPPGTTSRQGSEMLHLWFTHDLRSAFAIHAPEPELCAVGLLPRQVCR